MINSEEAMEAITQIMQRAVGLIAQRHMARIIASNTFPEEHATPDSDAVVTFHRFLPTGCYSSDRITLCARTPLSDPEPRWAAIKVRRYGDVVLLVIRREDLRPGVRTPTAISAESHACVDAREARELKASILDALAYAGLNLRGEE